MPEDKGTEPTKSSQVDKSPVNIAISKNSKILALFAIACTVIVGLVSELTLDKITEQKQN